MTIGDFLREVRERAELTQRQLAAEMGVTQSAVSKIERREDVLVSTLITFVKAAGGRYEINAWMDD